MDRDTNAKIIDRDIEVTSFEADEDCAQRLKARYGTKNVKVLECPACGSRLVCHKETLKRSDYWGYCWGVRQYHAFKEDTYNYGKKIALYYPDEYHEVMKMIEVKDASI